MFPNQLSNTPNTFHKSLHTNPPPLHSKNNMGGNSSKIEEETANIEGAVESLNKINASLATFRTTVYKSEFNQELPKPNDPDLIFSKKYSNMSYTSGINYEAIQAMVNSVLEIPDVLTSKRSSIVNAVTKLAQLTVGDTKAFAFSKAYTWRVVGDDGQGYLFTTVVAAAAIDTKKWGMSSGVGCQAAMTFCFRASTGNLSLPIEPKHPAAAPAEKTDMDEVQRHHDKINNLDPL
ncbi:hypothetical protein BGZ54_009096 [Gamsiella multidivaricata]|nr:hypothetical protein BGZ54_009096 [Gamsiella multidivaricata]